MNNWITKKLGEVLVLNYGKGLSKKNRINGKFPVFGSNGIVGTHNQPLVETGGLIVGRKGSAGEVHFSSTPFYPIDTTFFITSKDTKLDIKFLFYLLKHINLKRILGDVGIPGLNREMAYREIINYPEDTEEQRKIAYILSVLQKAIELQEKSIEITTVLKNSLIQKLFTEGLHRKKQNEAEIGITPTSWNIVKLREIATNFIGGGTPTTKKSEYWDGDIPWITSKWLNENIFLSNGEKNISEEGVKNSATNIVPNNNLIIASRVGVGKIGINNLDLAINQDLVGVEIDKRKYNLLFLAFQYQTSKIQQFLKSHKRGATIKGVTREHIKDIEFAVPNTIEEQTEIANTLLRCMQKNESQVHKKKKLEELFNSLLSELMTGKIRVHNLEFNNMKQYV